MPALVRHGVDADRIDVIWVPGSYEIPLACKAAAGTGRYAAVIALGAVIRGSTPHFDYVCAEVSKGVAQVGMQTGVPTIFGVITTDTIEQAVERAGTKAGNKGFDAGIGGDRDGLPAQGPGGLRWLPGGARANTPCRRSTTQTSRASACTTRSTRCGPGCSTRTASTRPGRPRARRSEFAQRLAIGVADDRDGLDELIERCSTNWRLVRMPVVDRNILRMAAHELTSRHDIPATVTINEAVELAKKFGTADSRAFVNGIVDRMARQLERIPDKKR